MITAIVNNKYSISAATLTALKRKASMCANGSRHAVDTMGVTFENGTYTFRRINKVCPWGETIYGQWR